MLGYYKNEEQTKETLKDGWLYTGDQGHIDEEGYVYLTGRVKDNFKTAKGKYIVPAPIEWKFAHNEDIEQLCVAGLGLSQPMIIIVPSAIGLKKDKKVLEQSLLESFHKANKEVGGYKMLSHLIIAKEPWTVENGILTPTLKVKRAKIDQAYLNKMEKWQESNDLIIWET
jgi:long-subunit acyl-CoA synthetase (AMP-forming)